MKWPLCACPHAALPLRGNPFAGGEVIVKLFRQTVRTGKPAVPYKSLLEQIAITDAARLSQKENHPVHLLYWLYKGSSLAAASWHRREEMVRKSEFANVPVGGSRASDNNQKRQLSRICRARPSRLRVAKSVLAVSPTKSYRKFVANPRRGVSS